MATIKIENVSYIYDDVARRKNADVADRALNNVSLEIPDGQFFCLIGHSGCGKTTLMRMVAGLARPTQGIVSIDGKPVHGTGLDRAVVFQNYSLFPWMKVFQNVEFGIEQASKELGRGLSKQQITEIADEYLGRVGMQDARDKYPYQLSGGMRQRVAIARALAMDTEILLFDEPFGALDVKTRCSLQKLIDSLWRTGEKRKTVFFITHDISEAILLADRIVFMRHGAILDDRLVNIERPRSSSLLEQNPQAVALRENLTELFYLDPDEEDFDEELV